MKMTSDKRAIDKIYKRRDRYEIPDWQREEVWSRGQQQELIDSILRKWKLPKFYFLKAGGEDQYEVVDGQQRLMSILAFFDNELPLSTSAAKVFGGSYYKELPTKHSDAFDDYEIEYDLIEEVSESEIKLFFQRLQKGLPLTSSEKLNSIQSKLRDFLKEQTKHQFFKVIPASNRRYGHFDILCKVAAVELEGVDVGLRFDDLKTVLEGHQSFSSKSNVGQRIKRSLDMLNGLTSEQKELFRNRTIVQGALTLTCSLVESGAAVSGKTLGDFFAKFLSELDRQIELGRKATDRDYQEFQRTVSANVKSGAKIRQTILMRKLVSMYPEVAGGLDQLVLTEVSSAARLKELANEISTTVTSLNSQHSARSGSDLFKATNRTVKALMSIGVPVKDFDGYKIFVDDLYFLFHEGPGDRLASQPLGSFDDVNALRTDLRHDVDHGRDGKVRAKRKKIGSAFQRYSGATAPEALDPSRFMLVQDNLLSALLNDLRIITP